MLRRARPMPCVRVSLWKSQRALSVGTGTMSETTSSSGSSTVFLAAASGK